MVMAVRRTSLSCCMGWLGNGTFTCLFRETRHRQYRASRKRLLVLLGRVPRSRLAYFGFPFISLLLYSFLLRHYDFIPLSINKGVRQTTRNEISFVSRTNWLITAGESKSRAGGRTGFPQSLTRQSHDEPHTHSDRVHLICRWGFSACYFMRRVQSAGSFLFSYNETDGRL